MCAGQRVGQEGWSPFGARMRSAVSESGDNTSLAGEERKVWRSLNGHEGESRTQPRCTWSRALQFSGGQGVHREVESEGHAEKDRAVIEGATPQMNWSAKGGTKVEPAVQRRRRHSFTRRTKVLADGTVRKNNL